MDKRNKILLQSNVDSCRIESINRDWPEYSFRAKLVLEELEQILGKPIANAISNAGYRGEEDEIAYIYSRLCYRIANRLDDLAYYAVTGDADKIVAKCEVDDPAKFWIQSLNEIQKAVSKELLIECIKDALDCLKMMEEIREIDMFAFKAYKIILDEK